jgi:ferredoxin
MRVEVDPTKCQGHTLCAMAATEVFHLREEDGHAEVGDGPVPPELEDAVRRAVIGCPEGAISISEGTPT